MKFSNPYMFYLIWFVIAFFGFVFYGNRKRERVVKNFISSSLISTMIRSYSTPRQWLKGILLTLSLFFLVLSLTGPLVGFKWEEVKEKGVDIMVALDCSRSMLATDIKPTRLEQAKREIVDLLNMMHSDRVGLVAFAGTSILQCPLTLDHSGFTVFLNALNPDYLPMGGTDISGALQTAINGFETDADSEKAIIIITDGESTSGDPVAIATEAAKKGIRIFCIGVGQEDGAPVPATDGRFKKDSDGRIIMSKVDDEGLSKIAAVGNGLYVKSVAGDMDLDQIYTGQIQKNMKKTTLHSGKTKVWENRFQWFLFPSVLLLIAEMMISERKKIRNGVFIASLTFLLLIGGNFITCTFIPYLMDNTAYAESASSSVKKGIQAYEQEKYDDALKNFIDAQLERPDMPELYYNIGSAAYKKQDYESALNNFTRAKESVKDKKDQLLKDKSVFNLGNTKYRMGDFEGAVKEFEEIPKNSELYNEAKDNIEFVKKKIEEKKKQEEQQKKQEQKNKENQDKQDKNKQEQNKDSQNQDQNKESQDKQNDQSKEDKQKSKEEQNQAQQGADEQKQDKDNQEQQPKNQAKPSTEQDQNQDQQNKAKEQPPQASESAQNSESADEQERNQQSRQHLLNRLEDKPGSAMMPVYSEKPVLKDW